MFLYQERAKALAKDSLKKMAKKAKGGWIHMPYIESIKKLVEDIKEEEAVRNTRRENRLEELGQSRC